MNTLVTKIRAVLLPVLLRHSKDYCHGNYAARRISLECNFTYIQLHFYSMNVGVAVAASNSHCEA